MQVHHRRDDFHIRKRKLRTLRQNLAVLRNQRTAIKIEAAPIATLLVRIEVNAAVFLSRIPNERDACIQFT